MIQTNPEIRNGGRWDNQATKYDALLVLSFGGPEGPDDVIPFLKNVTRGRGVPPERLAEVAEHYLHFSGVSPINEQNRKLIAALETELALHEIDLPIYFGNRNWHPLLRDTVVQMGQNSVRRCLVFVTSAFSSFSGCRQYREDIANAVAELGDCQIEFDKIRVFYNHPGFIDPIVELVGESVGSIPDYQRESTRLVFTAHSIPESMARRSAYEAQLNDTCRLVAELVEPVDWSVAYQSRSGSPRNPWLEPDILDEIDRLANQGIRNLVIMPIGFISDHMEVLFDLDTEAAARAASRGVNLVRVPTVGTHPRFVTMIREVVEERLTENPVRLALGNRGPNHDFCPSECCLNGAIGRPVLNS